MKKRHLLEGLNFLHEDLQLFESGQAASVSDCREAIHYSIENRGGCEFLDQVRDDVLNETASLDTLTRLINLTMISFHRDICAAYQQI